MSGKALLSALLLLASCSMDRDNGAERTVPEKPELFTEADRNIISEIDSCEISYLPYGRTRRIVKCDRNMGVSVINSVISKYPVLYDTIPDESRDSLLLCVGKLFRDRDSLFVTTECLRHNIHQDLRIRMVSRGGTYQYTCSINYYWDDYSQNMRQLLNAIREVEKRRRKYISEHWHI